MIGNRSGRNGEIMNQQRLLVPLFPVFIDLAGYGSVGFRILIVGRLVKIFFAE
jgi:hypothetical protein